LAPSEEPRGARLPGGRCNGTGWHLYACPILWRYQGITTLQKRPPGGADGRCAAALRALIPRIGE